MEKKSNPIVVVLGLIASLIAIFVFFSGKNNIYEVLGNEETEELEMLLEKRLDCDAKFDSALEEITRRFQEILDEWKKVSEKDRDKHYYQKKIGYINKFIPAWENIKKRYPDCEIEINELVEALDRLRFRFQHRLNEVLINE